MNSKFGTDIYRGGYADSNKKQLSSFNNLRDSFGYFIKTDKNYFFKVKIKKMYKSHTIASYIRLYFRTLGSTKNSMQKVKIYAKKSLKIYAEGPLKE